MDLVNVNVYITCIVVVSFDFIFELTPSSPKLNIFLWHTVATEFKLSEVSTGVHIDGGGPNVRCVKFSHTVASQEPLNAIGVILIVVCNKDMGDSFKVPQCGVPCSIETLSSLGPINQNDIPLFWSDNQAHVNSATLKDIDTRRNFLTMRRLTKLLQHFVNYCLLQLVTPIFRVSY